MFKKLFGAKSAPIGIDLGSATLKVAQVVMRDRAVHLCAAEATPIPPELSADPMKRIEYFGQQVGELIKRAGMSGRDVVLGLPASWMHVDRLRLAQMDERAIGEAVKWETLDKLPYHPAQALLRHWIAGQVHTDEGPKNEVIVMAVRRQLVDKLVAAGSSAKLNVVGIHPEHQAATTCLGSDGATARTRAIVDIGRSGTRVYVLNKGHMQFARATDVGGSTFDATIAEALGTKAAQAHTLRQRVAPVMLQPTNPSDAAHEERLRVEFACRQVLERLLDELDLCFRYHRATFPGHEIEEIVLVGGEPTCPWMARELTAAMGVSVTAGAPSGATSSPSSWVVAAGLSASGLVPLVTARAG